MRKVLFVGESPLGSSGNSNMMRALLGQLDQSKFQPAVYGAPSGSNIKLDFYQFPHYTFIPITDSKDKWGKEGLLQLLQEQTFDILIFVGIDIWVYATIFEKIERLRQIKNFKWISIFPYDLIKLRTDWVRWINIVEFPCVYSEYGYNLLKPVVPHIQYFRPNLFLNKLFRPVDAEQKQDFRRKYFPTLGDDFLFGFVGNNQIRKDPQRLIMAYMQVKKDIPDINLYLHTEMETGVFNLGQMALDCGAKTGDIISKGTKGSNWVDPRILTEIYNTMDCLVNCSYQEGLSWTLLEAMLSGVPIIASDTTAQTELVKDAGILVPCNELAFMPVISERGSSWVEARSCNVDDLASAMKQIHKDDHLRELCKERGLKKAKDWLEGVSNVNDLIEESCKMAEGPPRISLPGKKNKVLFCQHSSAGDIFMTTRCFKGIKERYGLPLIYMTQKHFVDIVQENPYIDEVLEWDEQEIETYPHVLNPHRDRIIPGHWGRNCNSILSDFYWKILMVEPDDFYIDLQQPHPRIINAMSVRILKPICIVHTTGGDPNFRTYTYMNDVCAGLKDKYFTIQVGGPNDFFAGADLNLCGKLTYRQTAWVVDKAVLSINVDSFISHLSGALGISQITLFGSGNVQVVRPNQIKGQLVCLVPDYVLDCPGLGPCSGGIRNCPVTCTGVHDPLTILKEVENLERIDMIRRNHAHDKTSSYSIQYVERNQPAGRVVQELQTIS